MADTHIGFIVYTSAAWEDLKAPASGINPPGAASDPDRDTTHGTWLFDAASTELVFIHAQFSHKWKEGTFVVPHIHWYKTTSAAGKVHWEMWYKWFPINNIMDATWTTAFSTATNPPTSDTNQGFKHLITSFGEVPCTGKHISDMLIIRLAREGGVSADTYGADASLVEFDIHYQIDTPGSRGQFTKE